MTIPDSPFFLVKSRGCAFRHAEQAVRAFIRNEVVHDGYYCWCDVYLNNTLSTLLQQSSYFRSVAGEPLACFDVIPHAISSQQLHFMVPRCCSTERMDFLH